MKQSKMRTILHDAVLTCAVLAACTAVSAVLARTSADNNPFAMPLYILAVALISRFTTGYLYGIAASLVGVVCVNYLFTYPFGKFDVTLAGYPLTFAAMLLVSVFISTLTTQVKTQERLRYEVESEKMRSNLLRAVSHDIRTPLASILGASSTLLENTDLPERSRTELLREINKDAQWLVRVTENLLSVTKFSADGVVLKKTDEVVEEIVGSAIVKFRKNHRDIPITVEKPGEILLAPMDAMLIEQVLINLFDNVVAHAENAERITVRITQTPGRVNFAVEDDGEGIPEAILPHIFDGSAAVTARPRADDRRNMGIGLSVCSAIIRAHGGEMNACNLPAGGACVGFWLPAEQEEDS